MAFNVQRWAKKLYDEERSGRSSVVSDDLQNERRRFTISELSREFPQISRTVLYQIIRYRLGYHKFWQDGFRKCSQVHTKGG
jgi:hypothetical protein